MTVETASFFDSTVSAKEQVQANTHCVIRPLLEGAPCSRLSPPHLLQRLSSVDMPPPEMP